MNTINSMVHTMATDGQALYSSTSFKSSKNSPEPKVMAPDAAKVAENIKENIAEIKESAKDIENLSEVVTGRKVQFTVSKELNTVIVTVLDSETNQVIKEIPSVDMQKLKLRIRKTLGNLYDKLV